MADQLATPVDLASALQRTDVDLSTATLLVEVGTAVVQAAAGGQRIVQVVGDTFSLIGTTSPWLDLPQIPATAVSAVTLDGTALTAGTTSTAHYKRFGSRLWRGDGWQTYYDTPSEAAGTYTHGYAAGRQELQLGRATVLSIICGVYDNPGGIRSEQIDDYQVAYDKLAAQLDTSPHLKAAVRKQYGRRSGLVRIG